MRWKLLALGLCAPGSPAFANGTLQWLDGELKKLEEGPVRSAVELDVASFVRGDVSVSLEVPLGERWAVRAGPTAHLYQPLLSRAIGGWAWTGYGARAGSRWFGRSVRGGPYVGGDVAVVAGRYYGPLVSHGVSGSLELDLGYRLGLGRFSIDAGSRVRLLGVSAAGVAVGSPGSRFSLDPVVHLAAAWRF